MNGFLTVLQLVFLGITAFGMCVLLTGMISAMRHYQRVREDVRNFITAPDPQTPSPLAQAVDATAQVIARGVIAQGKATLMGVQSGAARSERAAAAAAAKEAIPGLGALDAIMPGLSGKLVKNPQLLNLAAAFLSKRAANGGNIPQPAAPFQEHNGNHGRPDPLSFKL